ncbi:MULTISPECIES: hypothetical protein [Lactococcus]|jgi:hypothetical protein|uniref:hypothetical protein n=1 Tax=Lactococcus TaxID=1357 RepID=UPI0020791850|nr:hypothetical protein [Lactococcus petauri]USI65355.1 hypothetical protein LMK05_11090 [Lactococcus petauri]USI67850.1 hypothetical protein LMK04_10325 [Lactococcus petauri]WJE12511.1 hypothetical protein QR692_10205 [Lactococcus petauri]
MTKTRLFQSDAITPILSAINHFESFWDDLEATMCTYRFHRQKGLQFFGPEPSLCEVAGKHEADQDKEILEFYGSLTQVVKDYEENGSYAQWAAAFSEVTYGGFLEFLIELDLLPQGYVSTVEEEVNEGAFSDVGDFIERINADVKMYSTQVLLF